MKTRIRVVVAIALRAAVPALLVAAGWRWFGWEAACLAAAAWFDGVGAKDWIVEGFRLLARRRLERAKADRWAACVGMKRRRGETNEELNARTSDEIS